MKEGLLYLEVRRRSPGAVASSTDDGALVNVTGADEAIETENVSIQPVSVPESMIIAYDQELWDRLYIP